MELIFFSLAGSNFIFKSIDQVMNSLKPKLIGPNIECRKRSHNHSSMWVNTIYLVTLISSSFSSELKAPQHIMRDRKTIFWRDLNQLFNWIMCLENKSMDIFLLFLLLYFVFIWFKNYFGIINSTRQSKGHLHPPRYFLLYMNKKFDMKI